MDTKDLETKVKGWFSKSAKASKEVFEKAGDKVQDFTDKSVLKMEKKQLESKLEDKYFDFGKLVSDFICGGGKITADKEEDQKAIDKIQKEIISIKKEISAKEKELNTENKK